MRKTITLKFLNSELACNSAISLYKEKKEKDTIKILKYLSKNYFEWFIWLALRIFNKNELDKLSLFLLKILIPESKKRFNKSEFRFFKRIFNIIKSKNKKNYLSKKLIYILENDFQNNFEFSLNSKAFLLRSINSLFIFSLARSKHSKSFRLNDSIDYYIRYSKKRLLSSFVKFKKEFIKEVYKISGIKN